MREELPPNFGIRLATDTIVQEDGCLLAGGAPFRMLRLTPTGARLVSAWAGGTPVGKRPIARRLARTLLDAGLADPDPPPRTVLEDLSIIVPVRDQTDQQIDQCLAAVRLAAPDADLFVVDDGSVEHAAVASAAARHDAVLVRHDRPRGPSAARNAGTARTDRPLIAFVDADVAVEPGCLQRLAAHLDDPRTGAAAPRVLGLRDDGWIGRYEAARSPLDMGLRRANVAPGRPVSYVPSTTLLVRRAALPSGGFDETLNVGEDVDLVWRMHADGHRVVYDPTVAVRHDHRTRPRAFLARRWLYATSVGPLARRHPDTLPALRSDPLAVAALLSFALGRPLTTLTLVEVWTLRTRRALAPHTRTPARLTAALAARYLRGTAVGASHAVRRVWFPAVVIAAMRHRAAVRVLAAAYAVHLLEPGGPRRLADVALDVVDDIVAAAGTWAACVEHRSLQPVSISFRPAPAPPSRSE